MSEPNEAGTSGGPGPTGHTDVDAALTELDHRADAPPGEQVESFERAHQVLRDTLSSIDQTGPV